MITNSIEMQYFIPLYCTIITFEILFKLTNTLLVYPHPHTQTKMEKKTSWNCQNVKFFLLHIYNQIIFSHDMNDMTVQYWHAEIYVYKQFVHYFKKVNLFLKRM